MVKDIYGKYWSWEYGVYVLFVEVYGYVLQMVMYVELECIRFGRDIWLELVIVVVFKEDVLVVEVIGGFEFCIELEIEMVKENLFGIIVVKSGLEVLWRCECCVYCCFMR